MAYSSRVHRDTGRRPDPARPVDGELRPFLPASVANSITGVVRSVSGTIIIAIVAACWASLLWWSPLDPSLTHVTSSAVRNLLGRPGAILSDLLIETLGLATLALLLPPMFWGLALVRGEPVPRLARCIFAWTAAIAAAATALAAIPAPETWPSHHGLGGIAGEAALRLALTPLSNAPHLLARLAPGSIAALFALWSLRHAIGFAPRDYNVAPTKPRWFARTPARPTQAQIIRDARSSATARTEPVLAPVRTQPRAPQPSNPPAARAAQQFGPYVVFDEPGDFDDGDEFDAVTSAASSGIAARFAPATNTPHALQDRVSHAFHAPQYEAEDPVPYEIQPAAPATAASREISYQRPSLNLLERPRAPKPGQNFAASLLRGNARLLEDVLADFGVIGEVRNIRPGPVVTLYEFEPARGTRPERVVALADDIARGMGAPSARIAPLPGRLALTVELPNDVRETIYLRDIFDTEAYRQTMDQLPVALGRTATGDVIVGCLTRMPHVLVAGARGSGKSTGVNAMILSLIYRHGPGNCRFLMIDSSLAELSRFDGIPHLLTPVITDPHKALTALAWCVREMDERMKRMAALGVRSIDLFNNRVRNAKKRGERLARTVQTGFDEATGTARFEHEEMTLEPMPYIVIVIEELADLMAVAGRDLEGAIQRLATAARAAGIHLILASERPAAGVVTGPIRSSIPARMSYKLNSRSESRAVIGVDGAEQLLGDGDMIYANGVSQPIRVHGPYVSNEEVENVAGSLRQQGPPRYVEALNGDPATAAPHFNAPQHATQGSPHAGGTFAAASEDALFDRAVAIVVRERRASAILLQRHLNISSSWAAMLLARLEDAHIIAAATTGGTHPVLIGEAA